MKKIFIQLLVLAGVPAAKVKEVEDNWEKDDYAPDMDAFKVDIRSNQMALFKNDPDLVGEIQRNEAAKQLDIVDRWIKNEFGLTAEDIKDKKTRELIAVAKTKAMENSTKGAEQLNAENVELKSQLKKLQEEEIPAIKSQVEIDRAQMKIDAKIESMAKGFQYRNPFEGVYAAGRASFDQKYKYGLNEQGEVELLDKVTGLKAKNADGSKFVDLKGAWEEVMKGFQFIKESNAGDPPPVDPNNPPKPKVGADNKDEMYQRYPHLKKAEENAVPVTTAKP